MTPDDLQLLVTFADYGADEKEAWLDCSDPDHVEDEPHERAGIQAVRDLIAKLINSQELAK